MPHWSLRKEAEARVITLHTSRLDIFAQLAFISGAAFSPLHRMGRSFRTHWGDLWGNKHDRCEQPEQEGPQSLSRYEPGVL